MLPKKKNNKITLRKKFTAGKMYFSKVVTEMNFCYDYHGVIVIFLLNFPKLPPVLLCL